MLKIMLRFVVAIPPMKKLYISSNFTSDTTPLVRHASDNLRKFSITVYPTSSLPDVVRGRAHSTGCSIGWWDLPNYPPRPPLTRFSGRSSLYRPISAVAMSPPSRGDIASAYFHLMVLNHKDWESWRLMGVSTQRAWLVVMHLLLRAS